MCQSLAFSGLGLCAIATDTRWTWSSHNGREVEPTFDDFGAKLRRIPGGWVAATGDARLAALGLRALEPDGAIGAQAALDDAFEEARVQSSRLNRTLPLSHFLIGTDTGMIEVVSSDPAESRRIEVPPGKVQLHASWAPGLSEDGGEVSAAFARRIAQRHDVAGIFHAIALAFVEAKEFGGESMSDEVELGASLRGHGIGYWRGRATDMAAACLSPAGLVVGSPPVLVPFPELPAERVLFPSFCGVGL